MCRRLGEWLHSHCNVRELSLLSALLLSLVSFVMVGMYGVGVDLHNDLQRWSKRAWERTECPVIGAGVSYTGDCSNASSQTMVRMHTLPDYNFSDCAERLSAGCKAAVREAFLEGASRRLGAAARDAADAVAWHGRPRQLGQRTRQGEACRNVFVPWVSLAHGGDDRAACGYRTGLLSQSEVPTWDEALAARKAVAKRSSVPCWQLTLHSAGLLSMHSCRVYALEDPKHWTDDLNHRLRTARWLENIWMWLSLAITGLAAACAIAHCLYLHPTEAVCCWPAVANTSVDEELERVRFVRDRWRLFRANVLAEYQLVGSARDYAQVAADESEDASGAGT